MAFVSILIGSSFGFLSFLTAWLGFDYGMLAALGVYIGIGTTTSCILVLWMSGRAEEQFQGFSTSPTPLFSPKSLSTLNLGIVDQGDADDARFRSRQRAAMSRSAEAVH